MEGHESLTTAGVRLKMLLRMGLAAQGAALVDKHEDEGLQMAS